MSNKAELHLQEALAAYDFGGEVTDAARYGCGHINDTFCVTTKPGKRYILQRISSAAFAHPEQVMSNIAGVTDYLREKIGKEGETLIGKRFPSSAPRAAIPALQMARERLGVYFPLLRTPIACNRRIPLSSLRRPPWPLAVSSGCCPTILPRPSLRPFPVSTTRWTVSLSSRQLWRRT